MRWLSVVSVCVVALGVAAGWRAANRPAAPAGPEIVGGSHAQRAVVAELAARFAPGTFERVRLGDPNEIWPVSGDESWRQGEGEIGIQVWPASGGKRGAWEAELLAGAFGAVSASSGLASVGVIGVGRSASSVDVREVVDAGATGGGGRHALAAELRAAAGAHGAEVLEVDVLAPHGLAFAATVRTSERALFLQEGLEALLDVPGATDGWYVDVVDVAGDPVWHGAYAARSGALAHGASDRELQGCAPIPWFPLEPEDAPPPCPVE